jgi:hypothetical protein
VNEPTRDALIRRSADGTWQLLHQLREARVQMDRMEELATGVALRALLIYGLTGMLSSMFGVVLGNMVWRAIQ